MSGLDHTAARALREMVAAGGPSIADLSPDAARRQYLAGYAQLQAPQQDVAQIREDRRGPCRLKIWRGLGAPADMAPGLIYVHGGGWVIGAPESHEEICRRIANLARAVVIAPDYRLAPDAPFPAGVEDCAAACRDIHARAADFGLDPARIAVGGDSAGGNLAAVMALMARDGTIPPVTAQLLFYPNTDQTQSGDSFRQFAEGYGLSAREMAWFRRHYLPDMRAYDDWRAAPLRAPSLAGVAPAIVVLAGQDVLYSEGAAYAARLAAESHAVIREWPGQIHGFISMSALIPQAAEAVAWACKQWVSVTV